MAQTVERRIGSAEVTGSIPVSSLKTEVFSMIWISLGLFCVIGNFVPITQKSSARMRTRAKRKYVASETLCSLIGNFISMR
jgi:hypothetical protein